MADPIMVTAATALVAWTTSELAAGGKSAVAGLVRFLRERLRRVPGSGEVLEGALVDSSPAGAERLAEVLEREAARDPAFGAEFRARWAQVEAAVTATDGGVANSVSGDIHGPVVQARDIHGGISFGHGETSR
jgi:hypothetical protein